MQIDTELIVIWIRFYLKSVKKFGLLISNIKMKDSAKEFQVKVVLLGDTAVGKSSIVKRFANNTFDASHDATIGAAFLQRTTEWYDKTYRF